MARVPEYGTLGFNRGRADNEPQQLYGDGLGNISSAPPETFGDDPVWKMRQQHMASGAIGMAIGMLLIIAMLVWQFWPA